MKTALFLFLTLLGVGAHAAQPSPTDDTMQTIAVADTPLDQAVTGHDCQCITDRDCEETKMTIDPNADSNPVIIEACARAAHEANLAYCLAIGDTSQVAWNDAPEWQRSSCRAGARGAILGNTPEQSHESWLATKVADGWRYGEVKDPEAKTHPCMVPYSQLPEAQRAKDHVFVTVVRSVAVALGS